jgi:hypothetical protein
VAGTCKGGPVPGIVDDGTTTTVTCPATATAADGVVQTTCGFPHSFSPNAVFTGPVTLISHLTRDFSGFDIFPQPGDSVQLGCVYQNTDGVQIGGIYTIIPIAAARCTPTADSFICTD